MRDVLAFPIRELMEESLAWLAERSNAVSSGGLPPVFQQLQVTTPGLHLFSSDEPELSARLALELARQEALRDAEVGVLAYVTRSSELLRWLLSTTAGRDESDLVPANPSRFAPDVEAAGQQLFNASLFVADAMDPSGWKLPAALRALLDARPRLRCAVIEGAEGVVVAEAEANALAKACARIAATARLPVLVALHSREDSARWRDALATNGASKWWLETAASGQVRALREGKALTLPFTFDARGLQRCSEELER